MNTELRENIFGVSIIIGAVILIIVLALTSGCRTVGMWLAPTQKRDLPAEAQKMVEKAQAEAQAVKEKALKAAKPTSLMPLYIIGAIAIVGGVAVGWFLKQVMGGVLLALGGAGAIGWARFLELYKWAFWIPFLLCTVAGGYLIYNWAKDEKKLESLLRGKTR